MIICNITPLIALASIDFLELLNSLKEEWCSECGEGFLSAEDLALSKQERTDQKRIIGHV